MPFTPLQEKRLLQVFVVLGALVPVLGGGYGVINGYPSSTDAAGIIWENHFRYLSGILFAIGLGFWYAVPNIEHKSTQIRVLVALVVIGGISRMTGAAKLNDIPWPVLFALTMELLITPALYIWQQRVARSFNQEPPHSRKA